MKTIVRDYKNTKDFQRDANRWAKRGYAVVATTLNRGHLGTNNKSANLVVGLFTGGLGLLIARTPDRTTVTYQCATCK